MPTRISRVIATSLLAPVALLAWAGDAAGDPAARCEKEVRDYLQAMQFIRSAAGPTIGDRVAAGVASEDDVRRLSQQQGYCAAAQLIRERTAKR